MNASETELYGWRSLQLSGERYTLIIPLEIGLRILHCSLPGKENILFVDQEARGRKGGTDWQLYGGHRLWFAPEHIEESYEPDNDPVEWNRTSGSVRIAQKAGSRTGFAKEMEISFVESSITIVHRARNCGTAAKTISLWSITALAGGGSAVLPVQNRIASGLNPTAAVIVWPYTSMNDSRLTFGARDIEIAQRAAAPLKLGVSPLPGRMTLRYVKPDFVFEKSFATEAGPYPDLGTAAQCYTNENLLELEALGPSRTCAPGQAVELTETWTIQSVTPP